MATKLFNPNRTARYIFILVKTMSTSDPEGKLHHSDEIISVHKTRQGAEDKLNKVKPKIPTRNFIRYQVRKFFLTK